MGKVRLILAGALALALLWAGAGTAFAGPPGSDAPRGAGSLAGSGPAVDLTGPRAVTSGLKGLKPAQRKARRRAIRKCRKARAAKRRKRCIKRIKRKYRRIARRQARKPKPPAAPTRIHHVFVTDQTADPIQSSYFIPIPGSLAAKHGDDYLAIREALWNRYEVPGRLSARKGEAVRFLWDESGDSPHQVSLYAHPAGVDIRDFEMSGSAATGGVTFQRTFRKPGVYEFRCSLHQLTQILKVTVTR